jgi:hypothetical protein
MYRVLLAVMFAIPGCMAMAQTSQPATEPAGLLPSEVLVAAMACGYRPVVEETKAGRVNWTRGYITVSGVGKAKGHSGQDAAMARRAARVVAARNSMLTAGGLRVGADGRFANLREGAVSLDGTLKGFEEVSDKFDPATRTAEVMLRVPLYGPSGLLSVTGISAVHASRRWVWPANSVSAPEVQAVIIDARGLNYQPTLLPALITADGRTVFDSGDLPADGVASRAMAIYLAAPGARTKLFGAAPPLPALMGISDVLVVRPAGMLAERPNVLVVTGEELQKFAAHPSALEAMKQGRLIIVTD